MSLAHGILWICRGKKLYTKHVLGHLEALKKIWFKKFNSGSPLCSLTNLLDFFYAFPKLLVYPICMFEPSLDKKLQFWLAYLKECNSTKFSYLNHLCRSYGSKIAILPTRGTITFLNGRLLINM